MKRLWFSLAVTSVACFAFGTVPQPHDITLSQDSSRLVTITYKLDDAPAIVTLDIETNVADDVWASIGGRHVRTVAGDVCREVSGKDTYTITWRPDIDWPEHQVGDGGVRAKVTAWETDAMPECLVVDISSSADKADNKRYYPSTEYLPGGILENPDYRTNKIVLRKIRAKDFPWTKGSFSEAGRDTDGREDQYAVMLTNDYYMAVFETTQQQYKQIMGSTASNPSYYQVEGTMRPVEQVSFTTVRGSDWPSEPASGSVLEALRSKTGVDFDLPSEAQWEFACRAGNGEGYWGNGHAFSTASHYIDDGLEGRYKYNGGCNAAASYATYDETVAPSDGGTAIVGSYKPNSWGLYDMHGNVSEWCLDWWTNAFATLKALKGAVNTTVGNYRSLRGGDFNSAAKGCRSAFSNGFAQNKCNFVNGFRVVCTAGLR